jgi:hypothetical protein
MHAVRTRPYRTQVLATAVALLGVASMMSATSAGAVATRPYFSEARILWLSEAEMISSALQNVPLVAAAHELQLGLSVRGADVSGYSGAIKTIEGFERIPITSETPAQMSASHRDVAALNVFFDVSAHDVAVLNEDLPAGANYVAARRDFEQEPVGVRRGVKVDALKGVVADLERASKTQPSRSILYTSAIVDARNLERATTNDVATSGRTLLNPYGQDVYYLNVFFRTERLQIAPQ